MTSRATTLTVAAILMVALVCVAVLVPVPYVTMKPGQTVDTLGSASKDKPIIAFGPEAETYATTGQLRMTTVSVTSPDSHVGLGQAIEAWFDSGTAIMPRDLIYPPEQSVQEAEEETHLEMTGSQASAQIAGLTEAGYKVGEVVQVRSVTPNGPADGKLQTGDRVLRVDGAPVHSANAAVKAIREHRPGDTVAVAVERDGAVHTYDITTESSGDDPSVPMVGVEISTTQDFPFTITFNVDPAIGGPSAGTMFALAIYDKLTPGPLTDGRVIAGTGEIDAEGNVGSIGGIQQKILGAEAAGADLFMVPKANCAEALGADVDDIQLVEMATLDQAVTSLETLADNPDADVPDCA
ncbi:MAG TPA: PDZ domain-containing protein [Nocardioidaceae bacterium]|nr:PDZ domain-containing protein [Nocardioidaceae bacterium]